MNNMLGWLLGDSNTTAGAIDIIAIERKDDELSQDPNFPNAKERIMCSPFHLKFNDRSKPGEKRMIQIAVGDRDTDVFLRLGSMGEAFFVEKVKEIDYDEYLSNLNIARNTADETVVDTQKSQLQTTDNTQDVPTISQESPPS